MMTCWDKQNEADWSTTHCVNVDTCSSSGIHKIVHPFIDIVWKIVECLANIEIIIRSLESAVLYWIKKNNRKQNYFLHDRFESSSKLSSAIKKFLFLEIEIKFTTILRCFAKNISSILRQMTVYKSQHLHSSILFKHR